MQTNQVMLLWNVYHLPVAINILVGEYINSTIVKQSDHLSVYLSQWDSDNTMSYEHYLFFFCCFNSLKKV